MIENLLPLVLPPGLYRNGTKLQAIGRWYDGNLVRFLSGTIRPVGGWARMQAIGGVDVAAVTGCVRRAFAMSSDAGIVRLMIGTSTKYYVVIDGVLTDLTPTTPVALTTGACDSSYYTGGSGFGDGNFGDGYFGGGVPGITIVPAATWSIDGFGNYVVSCLTSDGHVWVWDGVVSNKPTIATNAGGGTVPLGNKAVVVTPERFLFVLGADGNPRRVQWPSQETLDEWGPFTTATTAGFFDLTTPGVIMAGRRSRRQTLIWTDCDLHTATFIGGTFLYSFEQAGENCGLVGPNAVTMSDTRAFWMGRNGFFVFDGFVHAIECEVRDYVFGSINRLQAAKIYATTVAEYDEVTWFYPSEDSLENDRYVTFNYKEAHWTFGTLARAAAVDRAPMRLPTMISPDGKIYEHESGHLQDNAIPFIESGPLVLDQGNRVMRVQRIVPDELTLGDVQAILFLAMYPTDADVDYGPYTLTAPTDVRLTARLVRLRLEQARAVDWRVGTVALGVRAQGRR